MAKPCSRRGALSGANREVRIESGKEGRVSESKRAEARSGLLAEDLWEVETYLGNRGGSEFVYDEELDVFRFAEDGRFAFCEEFADWQRLRELGYLNF